ncbi:hypothetical protein BC940DRAFT_295636 [Gongronella butleri]|nr:hypothetical protein BC940DRAFT_295636 [Gongronella butleri]
MGLFLLLFLTAIDRPLPMRGWRVLSSRQIALLLLLLILLLLQQIMMAMPFLLPTLNLPPMFEPHSKTALCTPSRAETTVSAMRKS